jgi:hypothetical protein
MLLLLLLLAAAEAAMLGAARGCCHAGCCCGRLVRGRLLYRFLMRPAACRRGRCRCCPALAQAACLIWTAAAAPAHQPRCHGCERLLVH